LKKRLNFLINGKYYTVPMSIEEPSVIAAASSGAKFIAENGNGFKTLSTPSIMIGQMQVLDCDLLAAKYRIEQVKTELIEKASKLLVNMVQRGGGLVDIRVKILKDPEIEMMIVEFLVNVCESMGANIVNTLVENMSPIIQEISEGRIGIRILSNLCTERRAMSRFSIPVSKMNYKEYSVKHRINDYEFIRVIGRYSCPKDH
jgi:degradative hydroxymethylglutaryl-CoA reductase